MTEKKSLYADDRAYFNGILEIMKKTEAELVARLDELREQKTFVERGMQALSVYEHINTSSNVGASDA